MVRQAVHAYRSPYSPGRWLVGESASASGARVVPGYLRTSRPEQIGHVVGAAMRRATLATNHLGERSRASPADEPQGGERRRRRLRPCEALRATALHGARNLVRQRPPERRSVEPRRVLEAVRRVHRLGVERQDGFGKLVDAPLPEAASDALAHRLERAARADGDNGPTGRLGLDRGDAEFLDGGYDQRPACLEQVS